MIRSSTVCDICDFTGEANSILIKHKKTKHLQLRGENINSRKDNVENVSDSSPDDFTEKINGFLQSINHLNKTGKTFKCDKCYLSFASDDFLKIRKETTHKI